MNSLWRCIRNRQWWCGRIYSSSKRFEIFFFIVQSLLQALLVLSWLCACIDTDTGVRGTLLPPLPPLVLALASLVARPCVGQQLTLAENWWTQCNADRLSINPSSFPRDDIEWSRRRCTHFFYHLLDNGYSSSWNSWDRVGILFNLLKTWAGIVNWHWQCSGTWKIIHFKMGNWV